MSRRHFIGHHLLARDAMTADILSTAICML
jgi:hypothetical protein